MIDFLGLVFFELFHLDAAAESVGGADDEYNRDEQTCEDKDINHYRPPRKPRVAKHMDLYGGANAVRGFPTSCSIDFKDIFPWIKILEQGIIVIPVHDFPVIGQCRPSLS